MAASPVVVWFRQDLRLADNPALAAAVDGERAVVAVYVLDDETPGRWRTGGAARWWLHHGLAALAADLGRLGAPLVLRRGRAADQIEALAAEVGAAAVHWNGQPEPHWRATDTELERRLAARGVAPRAFTAATLFEPATIVNLQGTPFRVFTPFWKACLAAAPPGPPLPAPRRLRTVSPPPDGDSLADWALLPTRPDWAGGLRDTWRPGEAGARARLRTFVDDHLAGYGRLRDRPEPGATSRLSPHLHFGEVSARQVWHVVQHRMAADPSAAHGGAAFLRELGWREFCTHLLHDHPDLAEAPLQPRFARFPWKDDGTALRAWQRGSTGYPIVDAGMRQLWHTGWMHNRVRMIVASFLVKHLLLPWQWGEAWFWDTLVDADLANNAGGWQWVAGCGADAAPYFRIFNPILQGEKFDPDGAYVRRWVPELARVPARWIHRPWQAPPLELAAAGVRLGAGYPSPIVDHGEARARALAALASVSGAA
ncbi:MAG: cryptochrome/photolyase family protein [Rhodospirillales bacterium]